MSYIKSAEVQEKIFEGGQKLGAILEDLAKMVVPGISAWDIDQEAEKRIIKAGGIPAFKGYRTHRGETPFPSTICASVNSELVHGIATKEKVLQAGDIFTIDIGMQWPANSGEGQNGNGYFTDTAITVPVGEISEKTKQLLNVTQKSLYKGIKVAEAGNSVAAIGKAVEEYVAPNKYGIVRDLVGHGVGHSVHEEPRVANYYDSDLEGWKLEPGVVIAIEPMLTEGDYQVTVGDDGWGIFPVDNSLSAHFEHTVIITKDGPRIATQRPSEKI